MVEDRASSLISVDKQKNWYDALFDPNNKFEPIDNLKGFEPVFDQTPLKRPKFKNPLIDVFFNTAEHGWTDENRRDIDPFWDSKGEFRGRHLSSKEITTLRKWIETSIKFLGGKAVASLASGNPQVAAGIASVIAALGAVDGILIVYDYVKDYIIEQTPTYIQMIQDLLDVYNHYGEEGSDGIFKVFEIINNNLPVITADVAKLVELNPENEDIKEIKDGLDNIVKIRDDVIEIKDNIDNLDWEDGPKVIDDLIDIGKDVAGAIDRNVGENELNEQIKEKIKDVEDIKEEYDAHFG